MNGRPVFDTHIHLFQVTRPGGVPWPPAINRTLHRDSLPLHYQQEARPLGIVASAIVEASPLRSDTRWMLDQVAGDDFFPVYVAQLAVGAPDFQETLAELAAEPRVAGVRAFLWSPSLSADAEQVAQVQALAARGFTLDLISRGDFNPKAKIAALADAVPTLPIVLDHLAGAKGNVEGKVDPRWVADLRLMAARPNVHLKMSALFDMWNPSSEENDPWTAPKEARAYAPWLDVALETFGPERVFFGSNWPVCNLAGTLAEEVKIAEDYLAAHGHALRDRVMHDNARAFYRRRR